MAPSNQNPKQDTFDKAFINVLHALQKIGFCHNVAQIEKHLQFPKRTLYQVLDGSRSVPRMRRHVLLKFFTDVFKVNPKVFENVTAPIFINGEPGVAEVEEPYNVVPKKKGSNMITMGDVMELDRLRKELADKTEALKETRKELKYCRDLTQQLMEVKKGATGAKKKTGQKTGQKTNKD